MGVARIHRKLYEQKYLVEETLAQETLETAGSEETSANGMSDEEAEGPYSSASVGMASTSRSTGAYSAAAQIKESQLFRIMVRTVLPRACTAESACPCARSAGM